MHDDLATIAGKRARLRYVLITPARNEAAHLEGVIASVTSQTLLPVRWVIVSDGSDDCTDEIVESHSRRHSWMQLLRLEGSPSRSFAGKAHAVNAGYDVLRPMAFDLVGNIDADITLPRDYYEFVVARFAEQPDLGVAGTPFVDLGDRPGAHSYGHAMANLKHVSGACQIFRRRCFEEIGGYRPIKGGGVDWVAVTTARMRGWKTQTFLERTCVHHRPMGTADRSLIRARFRHGQEDYWVGGHPLWQVARGVFQMRKSPRILGGLLLILGYAYAAFSGKTSPIPQELRDFHRREQIDRVRSLFVRQGTAWRRTPGRTGERTE